MKLEVNYYRDEAKKMINDYFVNVDKLTGVQDFTEQPTEVVISHIYRELARNIKSLVNVTAGISGKGLVIFLEDNDTYIVYISENDMILKMNYIDLTIFIRHEIERNRLIRNSLVDSDSVLNNIN